MTQRAAFFRVEGALSPRPTLAAAAWLAANAQGFGERAARLGAMGLAAPFALRDPSAAIKLAWGALRGMSEDRLVLLGEEYYASHVQPHLLPLGLDLLAQARAEGLRLVLISDNLDVIMAPLRAELQADDLHCNRLELRNARATGRLCEPLFSGAIGGQWLRSWAQQHEIDLLGSRAYGSRGADSTLLSAIGQPCTVQPDRRLRQLARDLSWPILEA